MGIATRMLKQTCVHWVATGRDRYGKRTYAAPVERACRWDIRQERFIDEGSGEEVVSRAVVYLPVDPAIDDVLCLNTLSGLNNPTGIEPLADEADTFQVRGRKRIGNLRQTEFVRAALL